MTCTLLIFELLGMHFISSEIVCTQAGLRSILRFDVGSRTANLLSNLLNLRMEFLMTNSHCLVDPVIHSSFLWIYRPVFKSFIYLCILEVISLRFCIDGSYFIFENLWTFPLSLLNKPNSFPFRNLNIFLEFTGPV